jgi:hypothetical protein
MVMPNELALQFVQFDLLPIEFGDDVGLPIFLDPTEFFVDVNFVHMPTYDANGVCPYTKLSVSSSIPTAP